MRYLIVIEKTKMGYSACPPDVQGCVVTGATRDEMEKMMREAIEFHLQGLRKEGCEVLEPCSESAYVDVAV